MDIEKDRFGRSFLFYPKKWKMMPIKPAKDDKNHTKRWKYLTFYSIGVY